MAEITQETVEEYLADIEYAVIADFGGDSLEEVLKIARADMKPFVTNSQRTQQFLRENFGRNMTEITSSTRREVSKSLNEGIRLGEDYSGLSKRLKSSFDHLSRSRRNTIATTEVGGAANFAIDEGYRQSGLVSKRRWVTTFLRSRDTHMNLSGEERGMDEAFSTINGSAMYPGSFGIASEDINCRCRTVAAKFTSEETTEDVTLRKDPVTGEITRNGKPVIPVTPEPIPVAVTPKPKRPKPSPQPRAGEQAPKFKAAKTKIEAMERLRGFVVDGGAMDLGSQPIPVLNSILKAAEETLGKTGISVENLGYITKKKHRQAYGLHEGYRDSPTTYKVSFQRKFLRDPEAAKKKDNAGWTQRKALEIAQQEEFIERLSKPGVRGAEEQIAAARQKIKDLKDKPEFYLTMDAADDPIYAVAYHEFLHAVDQSKPGLRKAFIQRIDAAGTAVERPTEYAYFKYKGTGGSYEGQAEAWTEIGTALQINMKLAPELKKIFIETWKEFVKSMLKRIFG